MLERPSIDLWCEKHTQARVCPPASNLRKLQEGQVRLLFHLTFAVYFIFTFSFMVESRFKKQFSDVDPEVLELIPFTNGQYLLPCICITYLIQYEVGGWSHGYRSGSRFFWISDIDAMLQKLAEYQHNIHLRHPGAQKVLEDFKARKMELVADIHEARSNYHPTMVEIY